VFENRVLRRIFGPKREEVAGGWRRLHNEEVHKFYASPSIIRVIKSRMSWAGPVARIGEMRVHTRKLEWKRQLGRLRRRWEDNIRMDFREIGCEIVDRMLRMGFSIWPV
jgi:hypothetical protein